MSQNTSTAVMARRVEVHHGDCLDVLRTLPDNSFDSSVTDPPYALVSIVKRFGKAGAAPAKSEGASGVYKRASAGFMGQQWDTGERAFAVEFWAEVLRVLKPGAHVLAFSGTRTYHRLACAVEDAGFEIRDQIGWLYGSGFPKSHNQGNGWGTALKPAWEPIVMARKPLVGSVAANMAAHGTGAINIDGCRVEWPDGVAPEIGTPGWGGPNKKLTAVPGQDADTVERSGPNQLGRWPANVIHDGSDEVMEAFPAAPGQQADISTTAPSLKTRNVYGAMRRGGEMSANRRYTSSGSTNFAALPGQRRGDTGSAARFFYSAKADATDRLGSKHPTVKPVDLMAYLCRLVTPPGGKVLDPFAGSGTTGMACLREGFSAVLIEREAEYVADIRRRLDHVHGTDTPLFGGAA